MAKRKPLSDEHKKNIAEALEKGKSGKVTTASLAIKGLTNSYIRSKKATVKLRSIRESMKAQLRAIPKGRKNKKAKNAIRELLKEVRLKIRAEIDNRKAIRRSAKQLKRVLSAKKREKRARIRLIKLSRLRSKVQDLMLKVKTPKQRQKLKKRLRRIDISETKTNSLLDKSLETISSGGVRKNQGNNPLKFTENIAFTALNERIYKPIRKLTLSEERLDMESLNEDFNELQVSLEEELIIITVDEIEKRSSFIRDAIIANQISKFIGFNFKIKNKVRNAVLNNMKVSLDQGKQSVVLDINKTHTGRVVKQSTSKELNDVMKLESGLIADQYVSELTNDLKGSVSSVSAVNIKGALIANNAINSLKDRSSKLITNISGSIPNRYMNIGRRQEFFANIEKLEGYQRSEVLDKRTCNICMSIDMRTIGVNDPMANMDLVHSHCRGLWVPIYSVDRDKPTIGKLPVSITSRFKTVDGKPIANSFKQLKKPIVKKANKSAQDELRNRI